MKRPASTPIFYRVGAARLTTGTEIEAVGTTSGGEVEFVLLQHDGRLWVGTGSDHTDREVETYGVTVSKQMCDKPLAPVFWAFDEVAPHWDQLDAARPCGRERRAQALPGGRRHRDAGAARPDRPLRRQRRAALPENTIMFCGTLAARGGVRPTPRFEYEIEDPVLGRSIAHAYAVRILPIDRAPATITKEKGR